jgi:transcriptional regulator with XRE-family HTH domain
MHRLSARIAQPAMSPDEQPYFQVLGQRIAKARSMADLTQVQLAEALGISQPQLAFYEVGKRRVPVSLLPGLAKVLGVSLEALIAHDDAAQVTAAPPRRTRRGPVSKLEQQLDAIARLPKAEQKIVSRFLDTMIAQHMGATPQGQEAPAA